MLKPYYTYRILVSNYKRVQVERWNSLNQRLKQNDGEFRQNKLTPEVEVLLQITRRDELNDSDKSRDLGEALFDVLFDDLLCRDFVEFYNWVLYQEKQLLRVELNIDEQSMPEVASLPWEFMCLPQRSKLGIIKLATSPKLVFSRCQSQRMTPQSIQLNKNEKLKIALIISAPTDLGPIDHETVQRELENFASQEVRVKLLPVVNPANPDTIDKVLEQEPHIFHFIGHGRLQNENDRSSGQIAFVNELGIARWVNADYFSELLNRHRPGVVILQACESGMQIASKAFVGVASLVVQQSIPVVVAMQYEVSNSTANRFSRRFYEELAKGTPVDIAVQEGRLAIAHSPVEYKKRDFATPIIFMGVPDGYLFKWSDDNSTVRSVVEVASDLPPLSDDNNSRVRLDDKIASDPSLLTTFQFDIATIELKRSGLFGGSNKLTINRDRRLQAQYFSEDLGNEVTLEMVAIPGGTFTMGSSKTEADSSDNERPQHPVTVNPFFMGKYPITQAQWQAVAAFEQINRKLDPDPSYFKGSDRPVEQVLWYDAVEFCDRLAKATGRDYRLPSEAEWEYACRAGTTTPFHFGETIVPKLANYDGNHTYGAGYKGEYRKQTTNVGSFQVANVFGLYDMHGNVWEWCADSWHDNYENAPLDVSVWTDSNNKYRVLRGGSWVNNPRDCRSAFRNWFVPDSRNYNFGFRVVVSGARTL